MLGFRLLFVMLVLGGWASTLTAQLASIDSGVGGAGLTQWSDVLLREWGATESWARIRTQPYPDGPEDIGIVMEEVAGLARLRDLGFRPIPFYRWNNESWISGVRAGGGQRVPLDLREAYRRGFAYGQTYGAVVAGFEIENEPDIAFVEENAETYLAFQKAVYLGLKRGALASEKSPIPTPKTPIESKQETGSEGVREEAGRGMVVASPQSLVDSSQRLATHFPLLAPSAEKLAPIYRPIRPADRGLYAGHRSRLAPSSQHLAPSSALPTPSSPLVVMAPLALPPGPYFEQLVANGLFSYTDAFNYHYYGYAEDFTGVYEQFEKAVRELTTGVVRALPKTGSRSPVSFLRKRLPVLLTEYGFGLMDQAAATTVEGRVRQWRWFKAVGEQIRELRIAGPMAFYLPPYLSRGHNEFGLTMAPSGAEILNPKSQILNKGPRGVPALRPNSNLQSPISEFKMGGLTFTPEDFGAAKTEPWMRHIGERFGDNEATPALAWLLEAGKQRYRPRDWTVTAPPPSPVVIDFMAGDDLQQVKRYGGYLIKQPLAPSSPRPPAGNQPLATGTGTIVLYNFSDVAIAGRIEVVGGRDLLEDPAGLETDRRLAPMCRVEIPVRLQVSAAEFSKHPLSLRFVPAADHLAPSPWSLATTSVFTTAFFPEPTGMAETVLVDFTTVGRDHRRVLHRLGDGESLPSLVRSDGRSGPAARISTERVSPTTTAGTRQSTADTEPKAGSGITALPPVSSIPFATEEPRLEPLSGTRWRTTPGVDVTETPEGVWRFTINNFPAEPLRPAMAELDLPDDFVFPDGGMMRFNYRLSQLGGAFPTEGAYFEPYFRTANGNLFQVWPRQQAGIWWQSYAELKENYTMAFFGRANLPWRFRDNRIASLVFYFRPASLPATYEVQGACIVRLGAPVRPD